MYPLEIQLSTTYAHQDIIALKRVLLQFSALPVRVLQHMDFRALMIALHVPAPSIAHSVLPCLRLACARKDIIALLVRDQWIIRICALLVHFVQQKRQSRYYAMPAPIRIDEVKLRAIHVQREAIVSRTQQRLPLALQVATVRKARRGRRNTYVLLDHSARAII